MNPRTFAIAAQLTFYSYWLATEWIDLFPWNDIRSANHKDQVKGTVFHTSVMGICVGSFLAGNKLLMGLAMSWFTILLSVEICNWLIPYLFGVHPAEVDREVYAKNFSKTYRFLPPIKDHNIPDAQHVVVILLTSLMWLLSLRTLLQGL